jgi:hypothetical protein
MTTLTELLDIAYKIGHADGWRDREEFSNRKSTDLREQIIATCCAYYSVTIDQMRQKNRRQLIKDARHVTIYLLCEFTSLGVKEIGRMFGRDHSTAIYARNTITQRIQVGDKIEADINYLRGAISTATPGKELELQVKPIVTQRAKQKYGRKKGAKSKTNQAPVRLITERPLAQYSNTSPYGIANHNH